MRCPKCGFISFDHLEQCLKCKKNIKAVSDTLHGTVFHVAAPAFLQLSSSRDEESEDVDSFADNLEADEEFVDEDLDVLVEDDASTGGEVGTAVDDLDDEDQGKGGKISAESEEAEDREIEIDLSQFEEAEELEGVPAETLKSRKEPEDDSLSLDMPVELADISDLAPPVRGVKTEKSESDIVAKKSASNLGMDDMDFDLGLGYLDAGLAIDSDPAKETMLALDDIDFSETLAKSNTKPSKKQSGAGMDEDLNFDLDLGGLSLHKDT
ncbi:MAG: nucleolar 14 family protein [Proteobacteria bacterium]|nr:nucleolar 14 family protein [Pseudomonadota bacterium]